VNYIGNSVVSAANLSTDNAVEVNMITQIKHYANCKKEEE